MNSVKYLQGTSFSQLTPASKTELRISIVQNLT
jgi:hypothetical protein